MDTISRDVDLRRPELSQSRPSNKRKRDSPGLNGRSTRPNHTPENHVSPPEANMSAPHTYYPQQNGNEEYSIQQQVARHVANANASTSTAAAALAASLPQLNVPQPTELSFPSTNSGNEEERQIESSFDMGPDSSHQHSEGGSYGVPGYAGTNGDQMQSVGTPSMGKPAVGTEEWHKVRKDNHKEVERRRRETINEGINELAKIVPGCDKNKGAILQRGVQYISQLKESEARNIEKWTLEKMLTDQAIQALTTSVDELKGKLNQATKDAERWKGKCEAAGVNTAEETGSDSDRGR